MQHFPSISDEEFHQASQTLFDRAIQARGQDPWCHMKYESGIVSMRREHVTSEPKPSNQTICHARRDGDENELRLDEGDDDDDEDDDEKQLLKYDDEEEAVRKPWDVAHAHTISVDFSICRSRTYEVPVLWFTLSGIASGSSTGLDAVYYCLVPQAKQSAIRGVGVMGGISVANHPISDVPAFFVHPCRTAEALSEIGHGNICSPGDYLILWLGLVGPSVNLYVPSHLLHRDHTEMEGAASKPEHGVEDA